MTSPASHPMRADVALAVRRGEREEREDPALASVVGPHDEREVLDRHDHRERPEDERQDAEQILLGRRDAVLRVDALLDRVERARPDVAEDHPGGHQHELHRARVRARRRDRDGARALDGSALRWRMGGSGCHDEVGRGAPLTERPKHREGQARDASVVCWFHEQRISGDLTHCSSSGRRLVALRGTSTRPRNRSRHQYRPRHRSRRPLQPKYAERPGPAAGAHTRSPGRARASARRFRSAHSAAAGAVAPPLVVVEAHRRARSR